METRFRRETRNNPHMKEGEVMRMRRAVSWIGLVGIVLVMVALLPPLLEAQQKQLVTIASGWVTGAYYPMAGAMSRIVHTKLTNIRATVESSGASAANARLIGQKDADFAILQNDVAFYAYNGLYDFKGKVISNMAGVFSMHPEPTQIVIAKDAGIKSVKDLKGKRVAVGPLGSGTEINATQVLEAAGLKFEDLSRVERLGPTEASDQLKDARIDAGFFTVGIGSAVIMDPFLGGKVTLLAVSDDIVAILRSKYPFYTKVTVPAFAYKGLERDIQTVSVRAILVARSDLPESLVYDFTKVIFENLEGATGFYAAHPAAKNITLASATDAMPIPLHPGAAKFFKEKGVVK
jgi:hypothetical protein